MSRARRTGARPKRLHRTRQQLAHASQIGLAVSREQMRRHMLDFSIGIYLHDDGAPAAELLADLGWVLAVGAEIAANTEFGSPRARRLHGALCTVLRMSEAGGRWQTQYAAAMQTAAAEAQALVVRHPMQSPELRDSADWLAAQIKAGRASLAMVAGPELYATGKDIE